MLEKLAKQTAVYGISTIAVRFLSYLLTPVFTRVFEPEAYGIVTDVYALIPFALVVLTMGLESAYFRFAAKADAADQRPVIGSELQHFIDLFQQMLHIVLGMPRAVANQPHVRVDKLQLHHLLMVTGAVRVKTV